MGELFIDNVAFIENRFGVQVSFADTVELSSSAFANNSSHGLFARGVRQSHLSASDWTGNATGISLQGGGTPAPSATLEQSSISLGSADGLIAQDVALDVANTRIAQNQGFGLVLQGRPGFVALRSGTILEQNGFQLYDERAENQGTFNATRYLLPGSGVTVGAVVGPAELGTFYRILHAGNAILFQ